MKKGIQLIVFAFFLSGCATQLTYQPVDMGDIELSKKMVENGLLHQSPNHGVKSSTIARDYIKIETTKTVHHIIFNNIDIIELHEKHEWKIVSIWDAREGLMYRLYVTDEKIARDFINAIYTLKNPNNYIVSDLTGSQQPTNNQYSGF